MILTITLNPTIDKSSTIEKMQPESKLRCTDVVNEAGGGGINVSKALRKLDSKSIALFPAGGHNGDMLQSLLRKQDIEFNATDTKVETRENWIVLETSTNNQYRFTFPGLSVEQKTIETLIDTIRSFSPTYVVASGSLPPGLPDYFYGLIVKTANAAGAKCIVDTSGSALEATKGKHAYLIKPNLNELKRMLQIDNIAENEVDDAAQQAIANGFAEVIVVSMGPDGAWLVTSDRKYFAKAPDVKKQSTVGAGDSMVAGITYQLQKNNSFRQALYFGIACGTAATMNEGSQLFDPKDAWDLYETIRSNK